MKFVKERVNVICQELARLSISQKIKITDMQVKNGCYITCLLYTSPSPRDA